MTAKSRLDPTPRKRLQQLLNRQGPGRIIYAPNYWQWFAHQRNHCLLPTEISHCSSQVDLLCHLGLDVLCRRFFRLAQFRKGASGHAPTATGTPPPGDGACVARTNLASARPDGELASTGFCLADPGREYLVYLPQGGEVTVDLGTFGASAVRSSQESWPFKAAATCATLHGNESRRRTVGGRSANAP